MALVVEDGTGLVSAESYVSVATLEVYLERRGLALPAGLSEADKEAALVRASESIDIIYGTGWLGRRLSNTQALDWPRQGVYLGGALVSASPLPRSLVAAVCEAAWREASSPGVLLPDADGGGQVVSETVGPISVDYAAPSQGESSKAVSPVFGIIDKLLGRLTSTSGIGVSVHFLRRA